MRVHCSLKRFIYTGLAISALWGCASPAMTPDKRGATLEVEPVAYWPKVVKETSGLAASGGFIWTINDSGGAAALYGFDRTNKKLSAVVKLKDARNRDWESLAVGREYLYVADCGNNNGKRKQLDLYRVSLAGLQALAMTHKDTLEKGSVTAKRSQFSYGDYQSSGGKFSTNFDCEAVAWVEGRLWLFSKNWGDLQTRLYMLEPDVSKQTVQPILTLSVGGMITGADYNESTGKLALLGYSKVSAFGYSFIWVMDVMDGKPDWDNAQYHRLQSYAQWEGIMWDDKRSLFISSESSPLGAQQLARVILP